MQLKQIYVHTHTRVQRGRKADQNGRTSIQTAWIQSVPRLKSDCSRLGIVKIFAAVEFQQASDTCSPTKGPSSSSNKSRE